MTRRFPLSICAILFVAVFLSLARAFSDDALISLHSRLLNGQDMQAFHQQLLKQRHLHLRGRHNNNYHDSVSTTFNGDDGPMNEMMMDGDAAMDKVMDQEEMEQKMNVCQDGETLDCLDPSEHKVIMELLDNRHKIERVTVDVYNDDHRFVGVLANTTSDDPQVAAYLQAHVHQMHRKEENGQKVRQWDPLYKEMFQHLEGIDMVHTFLDHGISVLHTGESECAIELIQKHANVVTSFVEEGYEAVMREHHVPEICFREE